MKKRIQKILAFLTLMISALSAMQFTALAGTADTDVTAAPAADAAASKTEAATADPAAYSVEVALYLMESNDAWSFGSEDPTVWSEPKSESVTITEDGTYTLSLADLDIPADKLMLCYIKDVAAYPKGSTVTHSNVPDDLMIITDILEVNGSKKEVDSKVRTGLKKGIFDIAYRNNWDENDNCVAFSTDVKSIELTFTVTGITGEPGAMKYEPTQAAVTPTTAPTAAAEAAADLSAAAGEEDNESGSYLPIILGGSVAALIIIAIIFMVVRRRK